MVVILKHNHKKYLAAQANQEKNANQIESSIDYEIARNTPKIL